MPDCKWIKEGDWLRCSECGYLRKSSVPSRRNCGRRRTPPQPEGHKPPPSVLPVVPVRPENPPLVARLSHYREAIRRWQAAGRPTRADAEVAAVLAICEACPRFRQDKRTCTVCGCRVNGSRWALVNKARMATEECPEGRWAAAAPPGPGPGGLPVWAAAVTAAPRPGVDYLPAALAELAEAGWPDPLVVAEPGTAIPDGCRAVVSDAHRGPWPAFQATVRMLLELHSDATALLIAQDDVLIARGLRDALDAAPWPVAGNQTGVLSLYTAARIAEGRPPGWFRLEPDRIGRLQAYGACAVAMPRGAAERLLAMRLGAGSLTSTDSWLGEFCRRAGLAYVQHNPGFCQHIGVVSAVRHRAIKLNSARRAREDWIRRAS